MRTKFIILISLFCYFSCTQSHSPKEIKIINPLDSIAISGTLTMPNGNGPFPGVVLVAGTGKMDRNQTFEGHKFFQVLSDYLVKNGVATYRYDKRGVGESTGDFEKATLKNFASDALEALKYLKSNPRISKVGFIGHSEGGKVAPMATLQNDYCDFLVLMAPYAIPSDQGYLIKTEAILKARGVDNQVINKQIEIDSQIWELVKTNDNIELIREKVKDLIRNNIDDYYFIKNTTEEDLEEEIEKNTEWYVNHVNHDEMRNYNDANFLSKLKCPVFAITGDKDLYVVYPTEFNMVKKLIESNTNFESTFKVYPGLNHLFQNCKTCLMEEVSQINETYDTQVLVDITEWIKKRE